MPDVNANATLRKTNVLRETNVKLKANWHLRFTWQLLQEKDLFSAMLWGKYLELLGQCFQRTRGQPQFLQVCWMLILQSFPPVSREGVRKRHSERWTGWNVCRWVLFFARARCLLAGLRYLRLTRLPRHDRGPVIGGTRSAASCPCTVLRRASYHYATRSPMFAAESW